MGPQLTIKEFSRDLLLDVLDFLPKDMPTEIGDLKITHYMKVIVPAVERMTDEFFKEFEVVFKRSYIKVRSSEADFKQFVISRCLTLSADCTYLHFLLVCAFITELLFYSIYSRQCTRFINVGSCCLIAVFNKKFKSTFDEMGGWNGLKSFCESVNALPENSDYLKVVTGNSECKENILQLIADCDGKSDIYLAECGESDIGSDSDEESNLTSEAGRKSELKMAPKAELDLFQISSDVIVSCDATNNQRTDINQPHIEKASGSASPTENPRDVVKDMEQFNIENTKVFPTLASQKQGVVEMGTKPTTSSVKTFNLPSSDTSPKRQFKPFSFNSPPAANAKKLRLKSLEIPIVEDDRTIAQSTSTKNPNYSADNDETKKPCEWCGCQCADYLKKSIERYRKKYLKFIESAKKVDNTQN